ncbi:unnamed protein product [Tilletia controversa]|uniref:Vacuolar calcium ion transporter n=3 Tax=Tilletia TaxID=13289 RepID=A0A8X7MRQ1_9BASI|nr:hypothetical protein CF328_g5739 [Tilletia controversa]KAE8192721.1 hypothetical protein CF336_g4303 [Tilletia laevis]KAE8253125.1 hypothetical protein A4X03_0g5979 [Tilletia caries]KAE8194200.1 hypothetical protein CF335_g5403 [Tilletia laevis]KAE8245798.1 hypothetical protein A4X06_0g5410 [Tilletia controversa]
MSELSSEKTVAENSSLPSALEHGGEKTAEPLSTSVEDGPSSALKQRPVRRATLLLEEGEVHPGDDDVERANTPGGTPARRESRDRRFSTRVAAAGGRIGSGNRSGSSLGIQQGDRPARRGTAMSGGTGGARRSFTDLLKPEHKVGKAPTNIQSFRAIITHSWINLLLVFIPVSWALHFAIDNDVVIFVTSFLAIIPLAALLAFGTEEIAMRVGQTLGGLINATLGNAVELIVAIISLFHCELTIVQTSLVGSVLSNILLVLGCCFFAGGLKFREQEFKLTAAQLNSSLLLIAVIALLIPAGFHTALGRIEDTLERSDILKMSRGTSILLLMVYGSYLYFSLSSHKDFFDDEEEEEEEPQLNFLFACLLLITATVLVGVTSEWLVDAINGVAEKGVSKTWIGLILLPIVSNAAEHATAVTVAVKDKLDLSMGVAVGSSIQIALFVFPLLVIISWIAGKPLSLLLDPFVAIVLFLSVLIVNSALSDGKANYMEGLCLIMIYIIIALVFWFVTDDSVDGALFSDDFCRGIVQ